jgi:outer membrane protein OmpA-like peptidoglycan-associated protein
MNQVPRFVILGVCLLLPVLMAVMWIQAAKSRLAAADPDAEPGVALAAASDEDYCTVDLRKILRRVLQSCGLQATGEVRGCQPLEAKSVATISGSDFNALFVPLADRAGIIQFDNNSAELDLDDMALLDQLFADQRGASYFLVVARASPEGSATHNRDLSQRRGEAVLGHLRSTFDDPDLDREVGLLWLGEEFAQLDKQFCEWRRSGPDETCRSSDLNRSAFIAWIDCHI